MDIPRTFEPRILEEATRVVIFLLARATLLAFKGIPYAIGEPEEPGGPVAPISDGNIAFLAPVSTSFPSNLPVEPPPPPRPRPRGIFQQKLLSYKEIELPPWKKITNRYRNFLSRRTFSLRHSPATISSLLCGRQLTSSLLRSLLPTLSYVIPDPKGWKFFTFTSGKGQRSTLFKISATGYGFCSSIREMQQKEK